MKTATDIFENIQTGFTFDSSELIQQKNGKYKKQECKAVVVGFTCRNSNSTQIKYKTNPYKEIGPNFQFVVESKDSNNRYLATASDLYKLINKN